MLKLSFSFRIYRKSAGSTPRNPKISKKNCRRKNGSRKLHKRRGKNKKK